METKEFYEPTNSNSLSIARCALCLRLAAGLKCRAIFNFSIPSSQNRGVKFARGNAADSTTACNRRRPSLRINWLLSAPIEPTSFCMGISIFEINITQLKKTQASLTSRLGRVHWIHAARFSPTFYISTLSNSTARTSNSTWISLMVLSPRRRKMFKIVHEKLTPTWI